jgi:uncharacterized protein YcgI (DUF1989 family)
MVSGQHQRPINLDFYRGIRRSLGDKTLEGPPTDASPDGGSIVKVGAGSLVSFELVEGPQIVNVFFWNSDDPDERYWAEETMLLEGSHLQRFTRLWGTMARFRPLATVIDDSVVTIRRLGEPQSFHHFTHGGSGTPADWAARGGPKGVASTWERLVSAMEQEGVQPDSLTQNASLFQKTAIDPVSQTITILPSDAMAGDRIVLFAEIDLTFAVALSPYGAGGSAPSELDGRTRRVEMRTEAAVAKPIAWPYAGMAYPDLSLYLDETGVRDRKVGPTPGINAGAAR